MLWSCSVHQVYGVQVNTYAKRSFDLEMIQLCLHYSTPTRQVGTSLAHPPPSLLLKGSASSFAQQKSGHNYQVSHTPHGNRAHHWGILSPMFLYTIGCSMPGIVYLGGVLSRK